MNILNPTEEESDKEMLFIADYMKNNKAVYKLAVDLQTKIGMGGLWRGTFTVRAEIIRSLNDARLIKE